MSNAGWRGAIDRLADFRRCARDAPVDVSLCTTHTALIACARSAASARLDLRGVGAAPPVAGSEFDVEPELAGHAPPSVAKWPVSYISTRSPGDSVFTSAASQAPVPDAG